MKSLKFSNLDSCLLPFCGKIGLSFWSLQTLIEVGRNLRSWNKKMDKLLFHQALRRKKHIVIEYLDILEPVPGSATSSTESWWLLSLWGVELRFRSGLWIALIPEIGSVTKKGCEIKKVFFQILAFQIFMQ